MKGGYFGDYGNVKVSIFADDLEQEILNNGKSECDYGYYWEYHKHNKKVIEYLKEQLPKIRKMVEIMEHIDYLYSGEYDSDSFMEWVKKIEVEE